MKKLIMFLFTVLLVGCNPYVKTTNKEVIKQEVLKVVYVEEDTTYSCGGYPIMCTSNTDYIVTFNNNDVKEFGGRVILGDMYYKKTIRKTLFNYSDSTTSYKDVIKYEEIQDEI